MIHRPENTLNVTTPPEPPDQLQPVKKISYRRYFLMGGWARAALQLQNIHRTMEEIVRLRGSRFGVGISDDDWSCHYQRLKFQQLRIQYAIRGGGLVGKAVMTDKGWKWDSTEEIARKNRTDMQDTRVRAQAAKHKLTVPISPFEAVGRAQTEETDMECW